MLREKKGCSLLNQNSKPVLFFVLIVLLFLYLTEQVALPRGTFPPPAPDIHRIQNILFPPTPEDDEQTPEDDEQTEPVMNVDLTSQSCKRRPLDTYTKGSNEEKAAKEKAENAGEAGEDSV